MNLKDTRIYYWLVVIYVLFAYAFYPAFHLTINLEPQSLYQYLTQSFLSGQTYLQVSPSPELLQLQDPYNPVLNRPFRLHDASLFQGKYYLYFGPLPVIIFYIPFKLLTGFYPSDDLALFVFLSLAFFASFFLLIKIKEIYFPTLRSWQVILAGFLLSFANGIMVLWSIPRVYEVAIASALCFMFFALCFLFRFLSDAYKTRDAFFFSLCLALTVAGRPHFALICLVFIPAVAVFTLKKAPKQRQKILLSALILPPLVVALLLGGYNYLRFGSFLDFGHVWQLSCNDIKALHRDLANPLKLPRNLWYSFYFYFLQPFVLRPGFPYFRLIQHHCTYSIDGDYFLEDVGGILLTTPFVLLVLALPKLLKRYFQSQSQNKIALAWFVVFMSLVPLINLIFLLTLPFAIQRYAVDFLPYLVFLAILSFWMLEELFGNSPWFKFFRIIYIFTAVMSIILGLCFAMVYWVVS